MFVNNDSIGLFSQMSEHKVLHFFLYVSLSCVGSDQTLVFYKEPPKETNREWVLSFSVCRKKAGGGEREVKWTLSCTLQTN